MPSSLMEAASEDMVSSSKLTRGCRGLGLMLPIGTSRSAEDRSPVTSVGIRALSPLPSPLRRATTDLLG